MPSSTTPTLRQHWRFWQWPVVWSLVVLAVVLGCVGFARWPQTARQPWFDHLYLTLQLFVLGGNAHGAMPLPLQIARFLAPAIAAYTAAQALFALFHEQLAQLKLRFTRGHVVVCGLGRTGFKVVEGFVHRGQTVVVLEQDAENDFLHACDDLGVRVLIGSAADASELHEARLRHARALVIACGDDGTNVEVAIRAGELVNARPRRAGPPLQCHVHIVDDDLRALFKTHRVFTTTGDAIKVRLFNLYDASARLLFQQHALDRAPLAPDDPRRVHLIVVGFGQMGESVVLQAARIAHFANGRRLRVSVIDQAAAQRRRSFDLRNPQFHEVADLEFTALHNDDRELFTRVAAWCREPDALATVIVCFDDDARGLSCALNLHPLLKPLDVPILIRMTTDGGLTALLDGAAADNRLAEMVHPFSLLRLSSDDGMFFDGDVDARARAIHEAYVAKRLAAGETVATNPALVRWEELDEDLKDSNRQQADHLPVKLRALGMAPAASRGGARGPVVTPAEIEILARMEHARWNADRFLSGWTHAPGKKDLERKTSPHLVPWEALPDAIKEYDREAVREILGLAS